MWCLLYLILYIYYYTIILLYLILYIIILLYLILYSPHLSSYQSIFYSPPSPLPNTLIILSSLIYPSQSPSPSSDLSPPLPNLLSSLLFLFLSFQSISPSLHPNLSHSFYTCRELHILIYIPSVSNNLTPHVLSEWMVEV